MWSLVFYPSGDYMYHIIHLLHLPVCCVVYAKNLAWRQKYHTSNTNKHSGFWTYRMLMTILVTNLVTPVIYKSHKSNACVISTSTFLFCCCYAPGLTMSDVSGLLYNSSAYNVHTGYVNYIKQWWIIRWMQHYCGVSLHKLLHLLH